MQSLLYTPRTRCPSTSVPRAKHLDRLEVGHAHSRTLAMAEVAPRAEVLFNFDVIKPASSPPPGVVGTRGLVCTNPGGPRPPCPATRSQNPERERESGRGVQRPGHRGHPRWPTAVGVSGPAPAEHTATSEDRPYPRTGYPSASGATAPHPDPNPLTPEPTTATQERSQAGVKAIPRGTIHLRAMARQLPEFQQL
jgi:hypothetical protein